MTKVARILPHPQVDTHRAYGFTASQAAGRASRPTSLTHSIIVGTRVHTATHILTPRVMPLVQNNVVFHYDIHNYPERQRGKIPLYFNKLLDKCSDRLRKLLKSRLSLRNSGRQLPCAPPPKKNISK